MKIALLIEGKTEKAFLPYLRRFLEKHLAGSMPRLDPFPQNGRLPTQDKLKRIVERLLSDGPRSADAVIALTDVYTGTREFQDAADAKQKMRDWVGVCDQFFPHAAQYDFEAWLLPYWEDIQHLAGHNKTVPGATPEDVNHDKPPAHHIEEIFRLGKRRRYVKPRDVGRILKDNDLLTAARACPELKAFLNTILTLCKADPIA